jgi:hypothetical protein
MMKRVPAANWMSFNNILYIGDDARNCIVIIEKFNERLLEIEKKYSGWFNSGSYKYAANDKLQHHIHYHFEGGIAIFKFKNEDEIPAIIRKECLIACRELAFEQLNYAS